MSNRISDLMPRAQEKCYELQELAKKNGIIIGISECLRTVAEQDALYAQGRTKPGSIVTNARGSNYSSMHQWGIAFDFYLKMDVDRDGMTSDDAFNNSTGLFDKVGRLGQSIGLEWGGSWKSPVDKPHFQLPDWGSTASKIRAQYGTPENFMKTWGTNTVTPPQGNTTNSSTSSTSTATVKPDVGAVIRAGVGTSTSRLTALPKGTVVTILDSNAGNANGYTWVKVKHGTVTGYTVSTNLNMPTQAQVSTSQASVSTYSKSNPEAAASMNKGYAGKYKTTANLNLRLGAGTNKGIVLTIPKGEMVQNYGYYTRVSGTDWMLVAYGKYTGYCSKGYLKKQ